MHSNFDALRAKRNELSDLLLVRQGGGVESGGGEANMMKFN